MVLWKWSKMEVAGPERPERSGRIAHGLRDAPVRTMPRPSTPGGHRPRADPNPTPGRSLVTRRAVVDIVRAATLGSYGVTGFAASPLERLLGGLGLGQPGHRASASATALDDRARPDRRLRRPGRRGRPPGRLGRSATRSAARSTARSTGSTIHIDGLRFGPGGGAAAVVHVRPRARSARATSPTAGRTSPDGSPRVRRRRAARRVPGGRRQPRGARRRDQRAQRLPGPRRRHRHRTCSRRSRRRSTRPRRPPDRPTERIAAAISFGALMGARGNSGRHHQPDLPGHGRGPRRQEPVQRPGPGPRPVGGRQDGLRRGRQAGRGHDPDGHPRVGRRPPSKAAERDNDIEAVLAATLDAAEKSVARTPSLLAILREAGVVDSGGQGLYRLFQGALLHLVGETPAGAARGRSQAVAGVKPSTLVAHADEGFGYETMFLLQPNGSGGLDVDAIRDHLESIGESVLVAGDRRALKVHVHNERPDLVIGYGLSVGALSRISVENLDNQARDVRETRAAAFTSEAATAAAVRAPLAPATARGRRPATAPALGGRRGRRRRRPRRDLPRLRGRGRRPGRPVRQPEHRRAARGDRRRRRARDHRSCRTTRTSCSPRARSPR